MVLEFVGVHFVKQNTHHPFNFRAENRGKWGVGLPERGWDERGPRTT
jgi:hypothetical protein